MGDDHDPFDDLDFDPEFAASAQLGHGPVEVFPVPSDIPVCGRPHFAPTPMGGGENEADRRGFSLSLPSSRLTMEGDRDPLGELGSIIRRICAVAPRASFTRAVRHRGAH
eukprot:5160145-Pyramimonas_sp.AAC.1